MARYLMAFHSREGQTFKITNRLAERLQARGHEVELVSIPELAATFSIAGYDGIVIGASVRYGHFSQLFYQFIQRHHHALASVPSAFFGVNLTARKADKNTPETNAYMRKFAVKSPWHPTVQGVFAGACVYSKYRWYDKAIIRLIMKMTKGPTDPGQDVEFTDWQAVDSFAGQLDEMVG
ncbi:menaquinone-dependent protoporphyrinogen IX dehydrogenase [Corallincola spongiicola]|uniref:Protoporphyrinogen IX dehydrogenase [quinone] n=1 Tax=Corallincola spongiicola TaxID=2520508 RepID=A0ABY1WLG5_9GAMM|nr:menaquinone-dependent protoporphyrinogen IX dehydrogenase [Corallincola spongiicola]TAA41102.1 menaquinone-dependent protoporphyrinogen IX dehydrogenase [Corallincola spongiicola]